MSGAGDSGRDGETRDHGEGFLSRWSRRKQGADADAKARDAARMAEQAPAAAPAAEPAAPDERLRDPETGEVIDEELVARLPQLQDIAPGADLSAFMQRGVPEALRRQALRQLWLADPAIRDFVSPALDYAYDYNTPGAAPGFGPLSEDDIARGREMVARMFSRPGDAAENRENSSPEKQGDKESHVETASMAQSVRQSDAAVRDGGGPAGEADRTQAVDASKTAGQVAEIGENPEVRRSMPIGEQERALPAGPALRRRRGGSAAPV
jgi:hypothetical protein